MRARARPTLALLLACALVLLPGCRSLGGVAGGAAGAASGTASANPGVGVAVGIGVRAVVDEAINALLRHWSRQEQDSIALQVGAMAPGERRRWAVRHTLPWANKQGQVTVVRAFQTPLAPCKEAVVSVTADEADFSSAAGHFVVIFCRADDGWKWALAEPSVERWGALH